MKLTTPTKVKKKRNDGTHSVISYKAKAAGKNVLFQENGPTFFIIFVITACNNDVAVKDVLLLLGW